MRVKFLTIRKKLQIREKSRTLWCWIKIGDTSTNF